MPVTPILLTMSQALIKLMVIVKLLSFLMVRYGLLFHDKYFRLTCIQFLGGGYSPHEDSPLAPQAQVLLQEEQEDGYWQATLFGSRVIHCFNWIYHCQQCFHFQEDPHHH